MARNYFECRELPQIENCSVRISGSPDEVERLAVLHAVDAHGESDTPALRQAIREILHRDNRTSFAWEEGTDMWFW